MKGISLPINMIVIVAIAVLVLVVVAGYFGGAFVGGVGTIQFEQAFSQACGQLRNLYNCATDSIDNAKVRYQPTGASQAGEYSLEDLCVQKLGKGTVTSPNQGRLSGDDPINCVVACGCPRR